MLLETTNITFSQVKISLQFDNYTEKYNFVATISYIRLTSVFIVSWSCDNWVKFIWTKQSICNLHIISI